MPHVQWLFNLKVSSKEKRVPLEICYTIFLEANIETKSIDNLFKSALYYKVQFERYSMKEDEKCLYT